MSDTSLPTSLQEALAAAAAGWRPADAPLAALLSIARDAAARPAPDETQRFTFRTLEARTSDPAPPLDLRGAFRDAVLVWLRKRDGNPFMSMITLGRAANNDIIVPVPTLSAVHLIFSVVPGGHTVSDQGTTNGSWLNGTPLVERVARPVRPGDFLVAGGNVRLLLLDGPGLVDFASS